MSFQDKVVLVTGASSGIGAAIAEKFAAEGAKVAIVARNTTKLAEVSKKCEEVGSKPLVIVADVTTEESARKAVSQTIDQFGKLDVLINNAGIMNFASILDENAIEAFDHTMVTNLRSVVCFTHIAGPHIVASKGNIINISSIAALGVVVDKAFAYCTSKAGLDHFTRCMALELAPKGVRVNTINPGPVRTDIISNSMGVDKATQDAMYEGSENVTPLGRISESEEVADLTLFLASDKAKGITGSSYVIDNGIILLGLLKNE
ncbi:glucose 1-dehydrogenase 2-like [Manduca sexta]|uniref:glucose 1-dehydrogenase 2-like n=1 Tax=Manduca sexta TaxID=7130 RepID=UPI00188F2A4D|nr:glucose 1-dehydrogenase 2-like [Manduca sexta]